MAVSTSRAKVGLGSKVVFTQSGSIGEILSITGVGWERGFFDATHMEVPSLDDVHTNGQQIPSDLARFKPWTVTAHFDSALGFPPAREPETIELVLPKRKAELVPAKLSATGWISDVTMGLEVDAKAVATFTMQFTGDYLYQRPVLL